MKTNHIIAIVCLILAVAVSVVLAPNISSFLLDEVPTNSTPNRAELNSEVNLEELSIKHNLPKYHGYQKTVAEIEKDYFYTHAFTSLDYNQVLFDQLNDDAIQLGWNKTHQLYSDQEVTNIYQMRISDHFEQLQINARTYKDGTPAILGISKFIFDQDVLAYPKGYIINFLISEDPKVHLMVNYTTDEPRNTVLGWYKNELNKHGWSFVETEKYITANIAIKNVLYKYLISYPNPSATGKFSWSIGLIKGVE